MKILVTGAAGFLGSHMVDALKAAGHTVVGLDNNTGGDNQPHVDAFYGADILVPRQVARAVVGCDVVVHCAALAYEGLSVFSPRLVTENIVTGTVTVAVEAIKAGVKKFLNCSSMARYGSNELPYTETMTPAPVDPYGCAKVAAERILNSLGSAHGMTVVHAVPHNIIGPRQKYDDPYRNVVSIMVNRMLQGKPPVIYGDGLQQRCFSYIDDVVPVILKLLDLTGSRHYHGSVFNVGPDARYAVTINYVAGELRRIMGFKEPAIHVEDRPMEVKHAACSSAKIEHWFNYSAKTSLERALMNTAGWIKVHGPKPFSYRLPIEIESELTPKTWKEKLL